ncbi:hypothetical protein JHK84_030049 [Glycine max]|nr:hypothetical protein JHK84_030049 [Glycine max]
MVTTQRMQLRPLWVHPHGPIEQSWLGRTILVTRPKLDALRDFTYISVIGGTGDFFMARGVATLSTDAFSWHGAYPRQEQRKEVP